MLLQLVVQLNKTQRAGQLASSAHSPEPQHAADIVFCQLLKVKSVAVQQPCSRSCAGKCCSLVLLCPVVLSVAAFPVSSFTLGLRMVLVLMACMAW